MADKLHQGTRKTEKSYDHAAADGTRIAPGPFIGIVKANTDILYSGRLQVWIPELGGDPNDDRSWRSVAYSTPFYGTTPGHNSTDYKGAPHSYGMWFVPPDIGVQVLCIFVNGDPARGYWIGCVPEWPSLHMVPGMAGKLDGTSPSPLVDYYVDPNVDPDLSHVKNLQRFVHEDQEKTWSEQGILKDPDRGPGTSSAFRETPSAVFGISTPGTAISEDALAGVSGRKGGHTFVMDDGDSNGKNKQMRFRTAAGHMILMNDTKDFIYVINSKGTAWVELTGQGDINIFGQSTMNITAKTGFNLETDGGITMHAKKDINMKSDANINFEGKDINVKGSGSTKVSGSNGLHLKGKNTYLTGDTCLQIKSNGHLDLKGSCVTLNTANATAAQEAGGATGPQNMPTKEPFKRSTPQGGGVQNPASQPSYGSQQGQSTSSGPYGATNNYGSSNVPSGYGPMTNNVGPITYNNGPQGGDGGQSNPVSQYIPVNYDSGTAQSYVVQSLLQNVTYGTGASFDVLGVSNNKKSSQYSAGEQQNNPGNLQYSTLDKFAVGFSNGLAVYTRPEDGIAALMTLFDSYLTSSPITSIKLISNYLQAKNLTDVNVVDFARFVQNNSGINPTDYVNLTEPQTRIAWATVVIKKIQGRILYTYDQVVLGCAESLGLSPTAFTAPITSKKPWNNGTSYSNATNNNTSGFVSPAKSNMSGGQSSILDNIVNAVENNLINRAIGAVGNAVYGGVSAAISGGTTYSGVNQAVNSGYSGAVPNGCTVTFPGITGNGTQGSGGCATLAQVYAPTLGVSRNWQGTDAMSAGTAKAGDVYATFDASGNYTGTSGTNHTVIFNNYARDASGNITGAYVTEQYIGQPPHVAFYSASSTKYESFNNMQKVVSPTAPSGANVTDTQKAVVANPNDPSATAPSDVAKTDTPVDATSKVDAATPGAPIPPARPADLNVNYGSLDPQQRAELSAQYYSGTVAQDASVAPQRLSNPIRLLAADAQVDAAKSDALAKTNMANSALETFGPNDPRTIAFQRDAAAANNTLATVQSERDTIVATSPLLDKQPGDATGTVTAQIDATNNAYYATNYPSNPQANESNTSNTSGLISSEPYIPAQVGGLTRTYDAASGTYNWIGKDDSGAAVSVQDSTIKGLYASGQTTESLNELSPSGVKSIEDSGTVQAAMAQTDGGSGSYLSKVTDYNAPVDTSVSTNSSYPYGTPATPNSSYPYDTPRNVDYTPTSTDYQNQMPQPTNNIENPDSATGYLNPDHPYVSPGLNQDSSAYNINADPRTGEGTLSGGYADPVQTPTTSSSTDSSYLPIEKPATPVTGTTEKPGSGGATGGATTPQGSAATAPNAGSC